MFLWELVQEEETNDWDWGGEEENNDWDCGGEEENNDWEWGEEETNDWEWGEEEENNDCEGGREEEIGGEDVLEEIELRLEDGIDIKERLDENEEGDVSFRSSILLVLHLFNLTSLLFRIVSFSLISKNASSLISTGLRWKVDWS